MPTPTVIWTFGASQHTWPNGCVESNPEDYKESVLQEQLAGGEILAYDMGIGPIKQRSFEFRGVLLAVKESFENWRDNVVVASLNVFSHQDNTQGPPETLQVRLIQSGIARMPHATPVPYYTITCVLQVEPRF